MKDEYTFKDGDTVTFKSPEELKNTFGWNGTHITHPVYIVGDMISIMEKNKTVKIRKVRKSTDLSNNYEYIYNIQGDNYNWTFDMFMPPINNVTDKVFDVLRGNK